MMHSQEKSVLSTDELKNIASIILRESAKRGADQAEVSIASNKGFSVTAREGDVETIEYHQDKSISVAVYFGKRCGSSSLSDVREEAICAAVDAACHIAKFTGEDPASGLADKSELAFHYPELKLAFPWDISVEEAGRLACECEREAVAYDKRIMSAESVDVTTMQATAVYANSHGFSGALSYTRHEMSCVLVAKDQNDDMQRDYSYTVSMDPSLLESTSTVARHAAERTIKRLGARRLPTMNAPVLFLAEEARGLLGHFCSAISGGNIYRKSSFLVDHLGKKVFPDFVQIEEQPHLAMGLGSVAFDDDGVLTRPNVFIKDGLLQSYALGVYSARKLGMRTTGNAGGMHNLIMKPGTKDFAALLKAMGTGLLVTELMGQGVNVMTGDYSRGAGGYWVENGEIQYPVHEITIAGKLQDIYARIAEVGNDVDVRGNIRTGSILIEEMMIAGE
jgi:PmbA protein